jgi:transcription termination factor NusB
MAIFWIVYLFIKNENAEFDNTVKQATLLHSVILFTFSEISVSLTHKQSSSIFRKQFSESQTPGEDNYNHIKSLILSKLNETVGHRHKGEGIDLKQLANNHYTQRYLDDIGNLYDKFQERLPENRINEISFLELAKVRTPLLRTSLLSLLKSQSTPISLASPNALILPRAMMRMTLTWMIRPRAMRRRKENRRLRTSCPRSIELSR